MTKDDLTGAYALNALSTEEREAHEAALRGSGDARNEATELQDTAVLLGLAVAPVTPSPDLKARLMAQIAVTPQNTATENTTQPVDAAPGPAELRASRRWSRPIVAVASMAAAVALIVGGIAIGTSSLSPEPADQAAQMAAISQAADVEQRDLTLAGGQEITLRWSPELATSVLIVDGMDSAPDDRVYQMWYIGDTGARSAGFLSVTDGVESWRVLEGDMRAGDVVGVTVEPEGGSTKPSTDPIMLIDPAE